MKDYGVFTDLELIKNLNNRDHLVFNEIHLRYYAPLLRYAYTLIDDKKACDDMLQDVFAWFWEHGNKHDIQNLRAYLYAAVRFQAAKFIRKGKVREAHLEHLSHIKNFSTNEESLEIKELKMIISSFIYQLPEKCAIIFRMSREENLSNKEIASKLGISETTVAVQIKRALDKLKVNLGNRYFWVYFFL